MRPTTKKILLWTPYTLTMAYLWWVTIWLRVRFGLSQTDTFLITSAMALYGALLLFSADIRRKYWPTQEAVNNVEETKK